MSVARRPFVMRSISVFGVLSLSLVPLTASEPKVVEERMRKDVTYLASPECEGRGVGTKGIQLAADYIASEFKKAGLKPALPDGGYFQSFEIPGSQLGSPNTLVLESPKGEKIELKVDETYIPLGSSPSAKVEAPMVFAGYGVIAEQANYDDYKDVDVAGKIVVVLRKTPQPENTKTPFDGPRNNAHASLSSKIAKANLKKAVALIIVNDSETGNAGDTLMPFDYLSWSSREKLAAVQMKRDVADKLLKSALGKPLTEIEAKIDGDLKPQSAVLEGWKARLEVLIDRLVAKNVVGVLDGEGPKASETIVVGAHYDHLGYGGFGSLARGLRGPAIHHGADDNASGTTAMIELARRFAELPKRERRMVFMAFSGEERGLLGSDYYCGNPIFPLEETAAMVNLDMVGRLSPDKETKKDRLIVYGTGTATDFDSLLEGLNKKYDFKLQKVATGMGPSDHQSFYIRNIPVFFLFTDVHEDYHRPTDTAEKINVPGMRKVMELTEEITTNLLTRAERPEFVKVVAAVPRRAQRDDNTPKLGLRPSYGDDKQGVLVSGVNTGGAAEKAGLKAGDRVIELAGKEVKNLEGYMSILAARKKGDNVEVIVLRDGNKVTVKVTLE